MIRWLLIASQCAVLGELLRHRLYRIFPQFAFYVSAATLSNITRAHPESIEYTRTVWAPLQAVVLVAMCGCALEAFLGENEDRHAERVGFALLLAGMAIPLAGLAYEQDPRWAAAFVQVRAFIILAVAVFFAADLALVRIRRWHLPGAEYRHLLAMVALFGAKAFASVLYLSLGKWRISDAAWLWTDRLTSAGAAAAYLYWAVFVHRGSVMRPGRAAPELRYNPEPWTKGSAGKPPDRRRMRNAPRAN